MIFGTFCVVMTFHVFFTYPETARKSLEEVDVIFEKNVPAWHSADAGISFKEKVEEAKRTGGMKGRELEEEEEAAHNETV